MKDLVPILVCFFVANFAVTGCDREKSRDSEKFRNELLPNSNLQPCADGTFYYLGDGWHHLYWLSQGSATKVDLDDERPELLQADAHGGIYVSAKKHLWYIKSGKPNRVAKTLADENLSSVPRTSKSTLLWYSIDAFAKKNYKKGYMEGHEEGYMEGYENGYDEYVDEDLE